MSFTWAKPGHPDAVDAGDIPVTTHLEHATIVLDLTATAVLRCADGHLTLTAASVEQLVADLTDALEELTQCGEHSTFTHPTTVPCDEAIAELAAETWGDAA
ncbi:hypothetical protein [Enterococcus hirae]|uniref:hypothetical protein n=1 Tax=Enterococcus hirae TaxID=1354 RepID=UPI0013685A4C|nr:hypothetical protein [Enterococcus hirae]NAE18285.1 hypothetical protein [Enterococcus hirae]